MAAREFYHYYQTDEHSKWEVAPETSAHKLKGMGAKRVSILSVSPLVEEDNHDNVYYKGPFYVDIDCKDLKESIASAQQLLFRVKEWEVPSESYSIFCSGSKGFHFYFHPKLFYSGKPLKKLPKIYAKFASNFWVPGLDFQPYCSGKGNLFRLPNVRRDDGKYKVYISPENLESLTPEKYHELTSVQPISEPPKLAAPQLPVALLVQLFNEAEDFVNKRQAQWKAEEPLADTILTQIGEATPPCVECLMQGQSRGGVTYNQVAMQLATYLVDAKVSQHRSDIIVGQVANKATSSSYSTLSQKINHAKGLVEYFRYTRNGKFSCPAMRSVLAFRPCKDCVVSEQEEKALDTYEIEERRDGYYARAGKGERRITSFLLIPYRTVNSEDPIDHVLRRAYVLCGVEQMGEMLPEMVRIPEDAWLSRLAFARCFAGLSNLKIVGTDNDIQTLKHWVLRDTETIIDQIEVNTVGIHVNKINSKIRYTYVEQGFSTNKWNVQDTHVYPSQANYRSSAMPQLSLVHPPRQDIHDYESLLKRLFEINEPNVVAPLLGWLSACHLKSHIMTVFQEFPLFVLWGGRGSGKTKTACALVSSMHGCDYLHYPPMSAGQTSLFAVIDVVTGTTTVPRIIDEFNKHGCRPGFYEQLTEVFKAGYMNAAMGRGRLTRNGERGRGGFGAVADYYFVTSPLLLLAEHAPDVPALLDRSYLCMLRESSISGRQEHMVEVVNNQERFWEIDKALMLGALFVRPEVLRERYKVWEGVVNRGYTERQAHVRRVIGLGLDHLRHVLVQDLKLDIATELDKLIQTYQALVGKHESVAEHAGYQTEIDRILMSLGSLISLSKRRTSSNLPRGLYEVDTRGGILYVDLPMAFSVLEEYYSVRKETMPLRQPQQFERILAGEKYYIGKQMKQSMTSVRPVVALSLEEMKKKFIDTTLFIE